MRISMKKDRNLSVHKEWPGRAVSKFIKDRKYESHITIDVDPA
jgi:hypothetical protein